MKNERSQLRSLYKENRARRELEETEVDILEIGGEEGNVSDNCVAK